MKRFSILLALSLGLSSSANAFDPTPPKLESISIDKTSLPEEGGVVTLTAVVSAPSYGLQDHPLPVLGIAGQSKSFSCTSSPMRMALVSGNDKRGTYKCDITLNSPLRPGIYELTIFPLSDKAGNATSFIYPQISVKVGNVAIPSPSPSLIPSASPTPINTSSPQPTPTVTVTVPAQPTSPNVELMSIIGNLRTQIQSLERKLRKICSAKPKPKGC